MINHPLHKAVADIFDDIKGKFNFSYFEILKDEACGGNKHLPFFLNFKPSRDSAVSNVDLMILKNNKVKLVCEIEESGFNPTKIFGKIFSTASAKVCRLYENQNHRYLDFDNNAIFLQIICNESFQENSLKEQQGMIIENEINSKLINYNSWIKKYRLIYGNVADAKPNGELYKELERIIKSL